MTTRLPTIRGYAAVYDALSTPILATGARERIRPGALDLAGDRPILCTIDHRAGRVVATTADGTLRISFNSIGLRVEIDPNGWPLGREAMDMVRRGAIRGMSFRFHGERHSLVYLMNGVRVRDLVRAVVSEVCLATDPAYPQTSTYLYLVSPVAGEPSAAPRSHTMSAPRQTISLGPVELAIGLGCPGRSTLPIAEYCTRREAEAKARVEARRRPRLALAAERARKLDEQLRGA